MTGRFAFAFLGACLISLCSMTRADAPAVAHIGFVWISDASDTPATMTEMWQRLRTLGWEEGRNLVVERRWAGGRIDRLPPLMDDVVARKVDVIVTMSTPGAIAAKNALTIRQRLPMVASMLEFVDDGALLSYEVDNTAVFRRMAEYVDKILRGAKAGDLPIEQPTQFILAVNLKTAKLVGVNVPRALLDRANNIVR